MLTYRVNEERLQLTESANGNDIEFELTPGGEAAVHAIQQVQAYFDDNRVITDVFFYAQANHRYRVIVRKDFYEDFILQLMKHRLLRQVEWTA